MLGLKSCSNQGRKALKIIQESEEAYTPDIVLAEVARKYMREGASETLIPQSLKTIEEPTGINPNNPQIAIESAKCYMQLTEKG